MYGLWQSLMRAILSHPREATDVFNHGRGVAEELEMRKRQKEQEERFGGVTSSSTPELDKALRNLGRNPDGSFKEIRLN